jgi:hypothetical protein
MDARYERPLKVMDVFVLGYAICTHADLMLYALVGISFSIFLDCFLLLDSKLGMASGGVAPPLHNSTAPAIPCASMLTLIEAFVALETEPLFSTGFVSARVVLCIPRAELETHVYSHIFSN